MTLRAHSFDASYFTHSWFLLRSEKWHQKSTTQIVFAFHYMQTNARKQWLHCCVCVWLNALYAFPHLTVLNWKSHFLPRNPAATARFIVLSPLRAVCMRFDAHSPNVLCAWLVKKSVHAVHKRHAHYNAMYNKVYLFIGCDSERKHKEQFGELLCSLRKIKL